MTTGALSTSQIVDITFSCMIRTHRAYRDLWDLPGFICLISPIGAIHLSRSSSALIASLVKTILS